MTFPSVNETRYHGSRPGLMVFIVPHGAEASAFLQAFPEIAQHDGLESIWPLFETYLAIERDIGASELAHSMAHQLTRRFDIDSWVVDITYPRGIIDGGRKIDHCLRHCLPTALLMQLKKDFLAVHAQTLRYMDELYLTMAKHPPAYLLDVHTMASFCPIDASGQRQTIPVSFEWLPDYVEQYLNAHQHAFRRSIDLISADDHGQELADPQLQSACMEGLEAGGYSYLCNQPYRASEAYLSHQHLLKTRSLSLDVPKHLLATTEDDLSRFELDAVDLDPARIGRLAGYLVDAIGRLWA